MIDATYADPLGEAPARPKTAGRQRQQQVEDEFADEEIGDDLLPEWWSTSNVFSNQKKSLTNLILNYSRERKWTAIVIANQNFMYKSS